VNENKRKAPETESERLLQRYFGSHGLTDYEFEPRLPESRKLPDFCLRHAGRRIILEVKEIDPPEPELTAADKDKPLLGKDEATRAHVTRRGLPILGKTSDPHVAVREKIEGAWQKLRHFPNDICCIVLYDRRAPGPTTLEPSLVYGAMFGKLSHVTPYDPQRGFLPEESFLTFSPAGGEMRWDSGESHKTNISAILVLEQFPVRQYTFRATAPKRDPRLSTVDGAVHAYEAIKRARGTKRDASLKEARVIIHENPFATKKLPKNIFCGPYDERYGLRQNKIKRICAGREIRMLEAQCPGAFKSPLARILQESAGRKKALSGDHHVRRRRLNSSI
jgi:hypothetical protein